MKLVNIGFGNMISADRIIAVVSPDSAPIKRIIQDAKEKGNLIDASMGRKTKAVLFSDSDHIILTYLSLEKVKARFSDDSEEISEEDMDE